MAFRRIEIDARPGPSRASWKRLTTTSVKARVAGLPALDLQRLCYLAAMEETVRGRCLQSLSLAEIVATLGLSRRGFDELFAPRAGDLHASFDEALSIASERVVTAYRAKTRGNWVGRMRAGMEAAFEAYDEERRFSGAFVVALPQPVPQMHLYLWDIPPGQTGSPYRHRLGNNALLLVLDGRPTLCTGEGRRDLHERETVVLAHQGDANELLNCTLERVRFLALSSVGSFSLVV